MVTEVSADDEIEPRQKQNNRSRKFQVRTRGAYASKLHPTCEKNERWCPRIVCGERSSWLK